MDVGSKKCCRGRYAAQLIIRAANQIVPNWTSNKLPIYYNSKDIDNYIRNESESEGRRLNGRIS